MPRSYHSAPPTVIGPAMATNAAKLAMATNAARPAMATNAAKLAMATNAARLAMATNAARLAMVTNATIFALCYITALKAQQRRPLSKRLYYGGRLLMADCTCLKSCRILTVHS